MEGGPPAGRAPAPTWLFAPDPMSQRYPDTAPGDAVSATTVGRNALSEELRALRWCTCTR